VLAPQSKVAPKKKDSAPEESEKVLAPKRKAAPKKKVSTGESVPAPNSVAPIEGEEAPAPKDILETIPVEVPSDQRVETEDAAITKSKGKSNNKATTVLKRPSASMASEENETVEPSATNNDSVNEALVGTDNDEADCHTGNDDDDNADGHDQQIDGSWSRKEFFVMRYVGRKTAAVRSRITRVQVLSAGRSVCLHTRMCFLS